MDEALRKRIAARREVVDGIRDALIECLSWSIDREDIDPDAFLFGSGLALDSLAALELVSHVERTFDVRLPDESMNSVLRTVNTLADSIEAQRAHKART
jgi:acyl carrier protein